jgi:aerobic carbon-monoxide dehydrogenase large subunit
VSEARAHRYIGAGVPRIEDDRFLRGGGRYVDDIDVPGQVEVAFLRSPHANARIISINTDRARAAPGVQLVLTGHDLGDLNAPLPAFVPDSNMMAAHTQLPLATERVRYVGEIIALVAADDRYLAEDAAALVEVEYEPLDAVVDLATASDGPGVVHEDAPDNIAGLVSDSTGDADAAFAAAELSERLDLTIERSLASPIEGRGITVEWDPRRRRMHIWASTQAPVALKFGLCRLLGLTPDELQLEAPDVGGGFGSKIMVFYPEEVLLPYAALRSGRSTKWTEDRQEHFVSANQERGQIHQAAVAFDREGRISAVRTHFLHDSGAYTPYGSDVAFNTATHVLGQYRIPNFQVSAEVRYTNKPPVSPYRGAGRPQAVFVMERLMAAVARRVGKDVNDVRRLNLIPADAFPYATGLHIKAPVTYDSGNYQGGFEMAMDLLKPAEFRAEQAQARKDGRYLGMGVGPYVEATAPANSEGCSARLEGSGKIVISLGLASQGQGHETTFAQICADTLGCSVNDVIVRTGNAGGQDDGIGTFGSRGLVMGGNAVAAAARQIRDQVVQFASDLLEVSPTDLVIEDGWIHVEGTPGKRMRLATIATLANPFGYPGPWGTEDDPELLERAQARAGDYRPATQRIEARAYFSQPAMAFASGVHAATLEVDPDTGGVRILKYVLVHDCGVIVNPLIVEGQVVGGLAQGIGGALLERLVFDPESGQPQTTSFMDFRLPTVDDIPEILLGHIETPSPLNPLGVKGTGEAGVIPVSAVIAEAIEDALSPFGVRIDSMPLFPDQILELVRGSASAESPAGV